MRNFNIVLFDGFETLDAFGPAEIIGRLKSEYCLEHFSRNGGLVTSNQGIRVDTKPFATMSTSGILLVPGGMGTRKLVDDADYIAELRRLAEEAEYVLTVCTGSGLLARTGVLDGFEATSNKISFIWAAAQGPEVLWQKKARWVQAGRFYTSSGVSAGMDMTLGFIADTLGQEVAEESARQIEYLWNREKDADPFAIAEA